jgi:hypothetical protein
MILEEFERVADEFTKKERELLFTKRGEYASERDVLQNFKEQSDFLGLDADVIALMLLFKHVQGIKEAVMGGKIDWGWETTERSEGTKQRIADCRNYLLLLAAVIDEEESGKDDPLGVSKSR